MHLKVTTVKKGAREYRYASVVHSVRVNGTPKHETVSRYGRVDHLTPAQLEEIGRLFLKKAKQLAGEVVPPAPKSPEEAAPSKPATPGEPEVGETRGYGDIAAIEEAWKALALGGLFRDLAKERFFDFDIERAVFAMVANRLSAPRSKYAAVDWLFRDVYLPTGKPLDSEHLYRSLTWLSEVQPDAELAIYKTLEGTGRLDTTAVFYDTSMTWFEGRGPEEIAAFGRDKGSHPSGRRLILFGLVRSRNGWPITHRVFPGNTADVATVRVMLADLVRRFGVKRFVFVGDRGMISEEVIGLLESELKVEYVLATKLRGDKEVRDEVLSRAGRYDELERKLGVKEVWVDDRRYVICRNQVEAEADAARRREIIATLLEKHLDRACTASSKRGKQLAVNKSFGRYLVERNGLLEIDAEKVATDARYDGKWVVRTNTKLSAEEVARLYKEEVAIERDFRDMKSMIELRPLFHHLEPRVRAHVFVCVLAKLVARELETRLHRNEYKGSSVASVLRELGRVKVVEVGNAEERRYVRTRLTSDQERLYRLLDMDPAHLPWRLPVYPVARPRRTALDHVEMEALRQERLEAKEIAWQALREVDRAATRAKRAAKKGGKPASPE
ncbi:MAG: IS1634 family transposase [Candidatus Binatia bacterium]